jgi:peroxiredoxin
VKAAALLLALACAALGCGAEGAVPVVRVPGAGPEVTELPAGAKAGGPTAADFSLQATDGRTVRLSDYLGKSVVLIDFWSTTCDPCMNEMPHLVDLYKAKKDKGFVLLAVSTDGPESLAEVNRVVHDKGMVFPVLLDQETTVVARYNPKKELPFWVLIDRTGRVIKKKGGYTAGDEQMVVADVEAALK